MNDTGTQQAYSGMQLGAEESTGLNRTYVNLRIGKIAQTSNTQLAGFVPAQTKNKAGQITSFYARPYDKITGYVTDIRWHTHTLADGTVLTGWNITIDTTKEVFVLGLGSKDRPFERVMNTLINVDFDKPVMFVGFMGKGKNGGAGQKVLLLSQEIGADGKPVWLQPAMGEKWLSRMIIDKLKQKVPLTEHEERNVSRMADGSFNKDYPYIVQNVDESWSLDTYRNFLHEQMKDIVIPNVQAANNARGPLSSSGSAATIAPDVALEEETAPTPATAYDDDIPF